MGFFKNIFKRKKGGTFVGNLLRGVSNKATGGILGTGAGLAAWEAQQAEKEKAAKIEAARQQALAQGRAIGAAALNATGRMDSPTSPTLPKKETMQDKLKKHWMPISLGVIVLYLLWKQQQPKKRRK